MKNWVLYGILLAVLVLASGCTTTADNVLGINLRNHNNLAVHIHPTLEINILGQNYEIPANTGISEAGMKVIHTHDSSGELHVESPFPHQFYLKDFFTLWGKSFNSTCIFEYCSDDKHALEMTVNGFVNNQFGDLPLKDGDRIKITYREK